MERGDTDLASELEESPRALSRSEKIGSAKVMPRDNDREC